MNFSNFLIRAASEAEPTCVPSLLVNVSSSSPSGLKNGSSAAASASICLVIVELILSTRAQNSSIVALTRSSESFWIWVRELSMASAVYEQNI